MRARSRGSGYRRPPFQTTRPATPTTWPTGRQRATQGSQINPGTCPPFLRGHLSELHKFHSTKLAPEENPPAPTTPLPHTAFAPLFLPSHSPCLRFGPPLFQPPPAKCKFQAIQLRILGKPDGGATIPPSEFPTKFSAFADFRRSSENFVPKQNPATRRNTDFSAFRSGSAVVLVSTCQKQNPGYC